MRLPALLPVSLAATLMGCTERDVRNMLKRGELEGRRTKGGHWRILLAELQKDTKLWQSIVASISMNDDR